MNKNIFKKIIGAFFIAIVSFACNKNSNEVDAYGNFEAQETIVSSEVQGKLISFTIDEGQSIKLDEPVAWIDTVQLYLKKEQLLASIKTVNEKLPDVYSQVAVVEKQIENTKREKTRVENLIKGGAATPKQLDDINAQLIVFEQQKTALRAQLNTQTKGIKAEINPLWVQVKQVDDQLARCKILNPLEGTVTSKYVQQSEIVSYAKPLYKIADLKKMIFRAFVSEDQLSGIKIGQTVTVGIDNRGGKEIKFSGKISWISDKAEFTPKTIQTKEERVNLVYAMKINVENDGNIKVGMPGNVTFK